MYPSIIKVKAKDNYKLAIEFNNGKHGILDMKPYLEFGVFKALKDIDKFKQVQVSFDTIAWNSEIDLDPEFIYENVLPTLK